MTDDKELIARLRDGCNLQQRDGERAADRIEALTKERDEADDLAKAAFADGASNNIRLAETAHRIKALTAELATCEKYRDAYAECDRIGTQAVRDLEAKLAKAVEALEDIAGNGNAAGRNPQLMSDLARATLAEIKGESHE